MVMPLALPTFTLADLDRFPRDGNRHELLAGTLLVTPGPGGLHQSVLSRLFATVGNYLALAKIAYPVSPGVVVAGNHTQLEPDLLVIPSRYFGAPWDAVTDHWLAVEVSGRGSRVYDRDYKRSAYLELGVREFWRLDLDDRRIYRSRPGGPPELPSAEFLEWHPSDMPAPLRLGIEGLFDGYRPSDWDS